MAIKINNVTVIDDSRNGNLAGITATGNITGSYILGNGSQLTGIDATSIQNGTSNVKVVSSGGNVAVGVGGTPNVAVYATTGEYITGVVSATGNITGGNISATNHTGTTVSVTGNITGGNVITAGVLLNSAISTSGNVTGANFLTAGLISATGNITGGNVNGGANVNATTHTGTTVSVTGNITGGNILTGGYISATGIISSAGNITGANYLTGGLISATGNITGGNLTVGTGTVTFNNVVNGGASATGNIGTAALPFNTVFAKATSAQYADLAEMYEADAIIQPGTVVCFGGAKEVTQCNEDGSKRVAGVVSTNPSYIMNAGLAGDNVTAVALTGRVPTKVTGSIRKGDMLVAAGAGRARAESDPAVGTVIGKALADFDGADGVIEVVVGRL